MTIHYKNIFLLFAVLFLTSCTATSSRQVLNNQDKTNIQSSQILLNSTQREIVMQHNNWFNSDYIDPYAPMDSGYIVHQNAAANPQAGLIGALVVSGIQHSQANSAMTAMAPIRNALEDFDFLSQFNSDLKHTLGQLPWLNVRKQVIKYNVREDETVIANTANENTTLFIGTTYALNSVFRQLEISAYVKLVQKSANKKDVRTLYTNNFFFVNRLSVPNENASQNKERWIKNNGALLKEKMRDASSLLSHMILMDIGNQNVQAYPLSNKVIAIRTVYGAKEKANIIKQQNGYYIVMMHDNSLYAVNADDIVSS